MVRLERDQAPFQSSESDNEQLAGVISENLTRGANGTYEKPWGGNMKTLLAAYEEPQF